MIEIDHNKYPLPKRLRHHTGPNLYIPFSEFKEKPEFYPPLYETVLWKDIFVNGEPADMLDIGCGKGIFLLSLAEKETGKNILGIEIREKAVEWINEVVVGEKLQNCRALWYSVVNGLGFIRDNSIEKAFYLFPDPWPKKKHHKRRAFNSELLDDIRRVLKPGGMLYLATDVGEVHKYHLDTLKKHGGFRYEIIPMDKDWGLPVTNKENFCRKENIHFNRIIAVPV